MDNISHRKDRPGDELRPDKVAATAAAAAAGLTLHSVTTVLWLGILALILPFVPSCEKPVVREPGKLVSAASSQLEQVSNLTSEGKARVATAPRGAGKTSSAYLTSFPSGFAAKPADAMPDGYAGLDAAGLREARQNFLKGKPAAWEAEKVTFYKVWGAVSPEEALSDAKSTNPGGSTVCVAAALRGCISVSPGKALNWINSECIGSEKSVLSCEFVNQARLDAFPGLGAWVSTQAQDPTMVPLVTALMRSWSDQDPVPAADWLAAQVSPERFKMATEVVFGTWVKADARAASEYLKTMPVSALRDRAVFVFATHLASEDAPSAETWGQSIQSPEVKAECLAVLASNHSSR